MNPFTGVLGGAWGLYRRFAAHFLAIAFVLYFLTAVLVVLLTMTAAAIGYAHRHHIGLPPHPV